MNIVFLVGALGKDPETKIIGANSMVCNFSMATSERVRGADGNWTEKTDWHQVSVFGKRGEACAKYLKKGTQLAVRGSVHTRKYTRSDGTTGYATSIVADEVKWFGSASSGATQSDQRPFQNSSAGSPGGQGESEKKAQKGLPFDDDDIPF